MRGHCSSLLTTYCSYLFWKKEHFGTGTPPKSRYFWKVLAWANKASFLKALKTLVSSLSLTKLFSIEENEYFAR